MHSCGPWGRGWALEDHPCTHCGWLLCLVWCWGEHQTHVAKGMRGARGSVSCQRLVGTEGNPGPWMVVTSSHTVMGKRRAAPFLKQPAVTSSNMHWDPVPEVLGMKF